MQGTRSHSEAAPLSIVDPRSRLAHQRFSSNADRCALSTSCFQLAVTDAAMDDEWVGTVVYNTDGRGRSVTTSNGVPYMIRHRSRK